MTRRLSLILPLLALPSLLGCGGATGPADPPPPSRESLAAIGESPGAARDQLARAIDRLFEDETVGHTRALVVMHRGGIAAERYASGYDEDTRFLGWSLSKCVTGLLIGLLVSDGRLRLDETAPVPAWQRSGDPRGDITLRQVLQMRSGLRHDEHAEPAYESDNARMLFLAGRDDVAAYAEAQPLDAEPGRRFEYSTAATVILSDLAARALTGSSDPERRQKAVSHYLQNRLFEPAGWDSMVAEYDAAGTLMGSNMIHATARDWARVGEFLRHGGSVRGVQVIPRRWIEFMRAPSPRNPGYGAHLWLNRPQPDGTVRLFPARAPEDLFGCLGHRGQYVIGSPSQNLTIARLGWTDREEQASLRERLGDLVSLYPAQ